MTYMPLSKTTNRKLSLDNAVTSVHSLISGLGAMNAKIAKTKSTEDQWKTFDESWGHGEKMIKDLKKRLPKVLNDANLDYDSKKIQNLISWLNNEVLPLENENKISGASAIYIFSKK